MQAQYKVMQGTRWQYRSATVGPARWFYDGLLKTTTKKIRLMERRLGRWEVIESFDPKL